MSRRILPAMLFRTVVLQFPLSCDIIVMMRYSAQRREAFGEAFDVISGGEALRFLLRLGAEEVRIGAEIGRGTREPGVSSESVELLGALLGLALAACQVSVGMGLWAIARIAGALLARMRRPRYYPRENLRRGRLARRRRRVRDRFTIGPCPEPGKLLDQYARARSGVREALVFGSMLCDLEAYCDSSPLRDADGGIAGRNPGVKGWLRDNCPELLAHYKNAMRYKGLAERFRQAAGAADPVPAAALAAVDDGEVRRLLGGMGSRRVTVRMRKANGVRGGRTVSATYELDAGALEDARGRAREILAECGGSSDNRPRCGKESGDGARRDGRGAEVARLRCGTKAQKAKKEQLETQGVRDEAQGACGEAREGQEEARGKGGRRGGVARLERILDARLVGKTVADLAPSRWRVGGLFSGASGGTHGGSECASA